jgi:hypothetical protein
LIAKGGVGPSLSISDFLKKKQHLRVIFSEVGFILIADMRELSQEEK